MQGRRFLPGAIGSAVNFLPIWLLTLAALTVAVNLPLGAQTGVPPVQETATIVGTVTDETDQTIAGAQVVLEGPMPEDRRTVTTNAQGFYELPDVKPEIPYHIVIRAEGFAEWTSPEVLLAPGTNRIVDGTLKIASVVSTLTVTPPSTEEVATQQVQAELKQRILGIFPNFYVVYEPHPAPLTAKLKFKLAFRVLIDPVTIAGIGAFAGIQQAADTPNFQQGAKGYFQRVGADTADGFTDTMIGGAILPSLLHQDPRYFYQGTGTKKSRVLHALAFGFACKGDNGNWQPNYSSLGGDLASSVISNTYYPQSNRGMGLVFENVALSAAQREVSSLFQEFILPKFTHRSK